MIANTAEVINIFLSIQSKKREVIIFLEQLKELLGNEDFNMDTDLTLISKKKQGDDQKYSTPYTLLDLDYDTEDIVERLKELTVEEDVIMTVGDFNIQQALIGSAEEAVDLAETAYSETKQRFMIGKADINSLTLSLNRQQEAQRNYISALQNYWLSYYKIRKLTLHDFETGVSLSNEFEYKYGL